VKGYHFTSDTLRDGRPIPAVGEWLEHDGPVVPCESGLHAGEHPFDTLAYALGPILHRVELEGDLVSHGEPVDKWVGRRRKILASIDATNLLREFARWCALQVIDKWDAPQVVRDYLTTGDESLRAAARAAGWAARAARAAGWAARAARDVAWDVVWDARDARDARAARDAARAARTAAGATGAAAGAAWAAARAARDPAWDARDAAGAAWAAARAARDPAWDTQRAKFAEMVDAAFAAALALAEKEQSNG
jgi:hypothetical protein